MPCAPQWNRPYLVYPSALLQSLQDWTRFLKPEASGGGIFMQAKPDLGYINSWPVTTIGSSEFPDEVAYRPGYLTMLLSGVSSVRPS